MHTRRDLLSRSARVATLLAAVDMLPLLARAGDPRRAAFEATTMADLMKELGVGRPTESKEVILTAPDLAENGAVVPVGVATALPGVSRMVVLVEKNPAILVALFDVTDAIEPNLWTRVKMRESSNVYGVVIMGDNRVLFAQKDVKVTIGGCGG
jgi:sulfur-oxidizing protein SoxY